MRDEFGHEIAGHLAGARRLAGTQSSPRGRAGGDEGIRGMPGTPFRS